MIAQPMLVIATPLSQWKTGSMQCRQWIPLLLSSALLIGLLQNMSQSFRVLEVSEGSNARRNSLVSRERIHNQDEVYYSPMSMRISGTKPNTRFSNNIQLNVNRGMNIINCWSGQSMATWIFDGIERVVNRQYITWSSEPPEKLLKRASPDIDKIQANDTIFVSFAKLQEFTEEFLPWMEQDFVLITEPWHLLYPDWVDQVAGHIVNHPKVLHWFSTNIGNYTGGYQEHPKVSPFPLGLKPNMPGAKWGTYRAPIPAFREVFLETLQNPSILDNKTTGVFVGYHRKTNERRKAIPSGPDLDYKSYLRSLAQSQYVLSPDGDHPDCHRHYEAIGMGSIPITEMDAFLYRHLKDSPIIFNNTNWNVTQLEAMLTAPSKMAKTAAAIITTTTTNTTTTVNRNMVFEEYWMEYVERVVGRSLRWWDVVQDRPAFLEDFAPDVHHDASSPNVASD